MVCFGVSDGVKSQAITQQFDGDRACVRQQSRDFALNWLQQFIEAHAA
jgi:nicotinamide mononucleotide (NMN) deamidase PncC